MNLAVFASGRGSNFVAIAQEVKSGKLKINIPLLICDTPGAPVLERAKEYGIKSVLIRKEGFPNKKDFEAEIIRCLKESKIDFIALAGFMRLLSKDFVCQYKNLILNIHPALLPAFKGEKGIKDAFDYGVKVTGVTVHFVDEKTDHGPIILQESLKIKENQALESLEEEIHRIEHRLYPEAVRLFSEGKLKVDGRKVKILS